MKKSFLVNLLDRYKWFGLRKLYWFINNTTITIRDTLIDLNITNNDKSQLLIKRSISKKLVDIYGGNTGHNLNFDQYFLGFGLIHYSFIRNIGPKNILCVGSYKGFIPAILALACKDNHRGHVDFVDAGYDKKQHDRHWSGIGFWKQVKASDHFKKINVDKYITSYIMTTRKYASKNTHKKYQYIYIDGDHSYKGIKLDYKLFWPMLDKFGFMSMHDIVAKGYIDKGLFGVWKFWKEIIKNNKNSVIFPFPEDSGLGIIQKTK